MTAVQLHSRRSLTRVYPKARRVLSDNLDPLPFWRAGLQMVALNFQTYDLPMQLNRALFRLGGGGGYVLKPPWLRSGDPRAQPPAKAETVRISILSLHHLPVREEYRPEYVEPHEEIERLSVGTSAAPPRPGHISAPRIVADIFSAGGGAACLSIDEGEGEYEGDSPTHAEVRTQATNGFLAPFDHAELICHSAHMRLALLRIAVTDARGAEVAHEVLTLGALRSGYRSVALRDRRGVRIGGCRLLVHVQHEFGLPPVQFVSGDPRLVANRLRGGSGAPKGRGAFRGESSALVPSFPLPQARDGVLAAPALEDVPPSRIAARALTWGVEAAVATSSGEERGAEAVGAAGERAARRPVPVAVVTPAAAKSNTARSKPLLPTSDGVEQGVLLLVAVASFQPEHSMEIPFARGEAVRVRSLEPAPEGWWYAEHRGRVGLVPQTFFPSPGLSSRHY